MAKTSAGSDAEDYVVDRDSSAAEATTDTADTAGTGDTADTATDTDSGAAKKRRFGRRKAGSPAAAAGDADEKPTVDVDKKDKAGKATSAKSGKTGTAVAGEKAGKRAKAGRERPALSGAARLARVVTALGLVAVLLAVLLVVQLVKGPGDGAARAALEDRKEAARSQAEISVARLFSFDYKTLDADFAAQKAQVTGDFAGEIDKVTNPAVRPLATKEHVVVQAVSVASATVDDPGPDVQVIVFMNQAVTLDLLPAPRLDRQRLLVSMRLVDGAWKVSGVKAL